MKRFISMLLMISITISFSSCMNNERNGEITDNAVATTEQKYKTYTGRKPLEKVKFDASKFEENQGYSNQLIEHSYGVAKDSKPHDISIASQEFFEKQGFNAITYDSRAGKTLYLTFDCGYENGNTSKILDVLKRKNVKAAFFCTLDNIKAEPELIARMINEGHIVGNHSSTHPSFDKLNRIQIAQELETCENYLRENFGYSSKYFRFPMGNYSQSSLDFISSLGFKSVFWSLAYADWNTQNQKGADYAYEKVTQRLHPGAVILLHSVSQDNADGLERIIDFAIREGYNFSSIDKLNLTYSKYNT